jgi:hypothetical protein
MLASHSPLGVAVGSITELPAPKGMHQVNEAHTNVLFRVGYVGLFTFIGRFAAQPEGGMFALSRNRADYYTK